MGLRLLKTLGNVLHPVQESYANLFKNINNCSRSQTDSQIGECEMSTNPDTQFRVLECVSM